MGENRDDLMHYCLSRIRTDVSTGYFEALPVEPWQWDRALAWCRSHPNDLFMRKHLLRMVAEWPHTALRQYIREADRDDFFLHAIFLEACLHFEPFISLQRLYSDQRQTELASAAPSIYIKAHRLRDHRLHRRWVRRLRPNFIAHAPLPDPKTIDLPAPVADHEVVRAMTAQMPLDRLSVTLPFQHVQSAKQTVDLEALTALALDRLGQAGTTVGPEMRHEASLSPIGLLRQWQLDVTVASGRNRYRLKGTQTAFGRGLALSHARASCVMEIVERVSAYPAIADNTPQKYRQASPLIRARLSELHRKGIEALDPNRLVLEAPYRDEPLYWMEGRTAAAAGARSVKVPAQTVFLFSNLDEPALFSGLGSNGLGAGVIPAQARCQAIYEVIERDCAAVIPYTPALCFDVETTEPTIAQLLQRYAEQGIRVGFLDLTGPLGLPCCKSYVVGTDGRIAVGTGAHLDARRALLSALTETTYPFPGGPPSQPVPPAAVRVPLESLPNYDRGDPAENLNLLENLLLANGFEPIYVDLTRTDLDLPVVRAIIPGMEPLGDFDRFARIHPRLYGYYLKFAVPVS